MYFLSFLAHPKPTHADYGSTDGAYLNAWVDEAVEAVAERLARDAADAAGWDIEAREEAVVVTVEGYGEGDPDRAYAEQAAADGVVLVLHTWPIGADEED